MSVDTPIDQELPDVATPSASDVADTAVTDSAPAGADTGGTDEASEKEPSGPKSMLEAVTSVFEKKADPEAPPASSGNPTDQGGATEKEASIADAAAKEVVESDYVPPEEWRLMGPKVRKRIDRLRTRNQDLERELEDARPISQTVREYDFSKEDVEITFGLMKALRKGEFKTFIEGVTPYLDIAREALGEKLPDDLQEQVDEGYTTSEIAAELARTRFQAQLAKDQIEAVRQQEGARRQTENTDFIKSSVKQWEDQIRSRDPDYSLKDEIVQLEAGRLVKTHGVPRSVDEALTLAKMAYERANSIVSKWPASARQATRPAPNGSARPIGNARAEPRSMLEAVEMGLSRS